MEWMNIVYVLYHIVCLLTSYAVETDQVTLRASAFDTGVTIMVFYNFLHFVGKWTL
ncbi:hypothetical protein Hdeb2414_s0017g00506211 [Helianthus debilis subsp. tardiflorus]